MPKIPKNLRLLFHSHPVRAEFKSADKIRQEYDKLRSHNSMRSMDNKKANIRQIKQLCRNASGYQNRIAILSDDVLKITMDSKERHIMKHLEDIQNGNYSRIKYQPPDGKDSIKYTVKLLTNGNSYYV